jgi:hypothetical protein
MAVSGWSQTAASNTSVGGISTDGTVTLVKQIDNMFRGLMAEVAVARDDGTISAVLPRGQIHGLTLSNNAGDATNDIDIAVGEAATSDSPYWKITLPASITKRLDAAWAVGTNQGGLDTGSIADATYHVWLIQRSDTLVVDVLFSLSATSPTMPTNYDRKRRIGSIIRAAAAITPFVQINNTFRRNTSPLLESATGSSITDALLTLAGVPAGIVVQPIVSFDLGTTTNGFAILVGSGGAANAQFRAVATGTNANHSSYNTLFGGFYTNTSRQIRHTQINLGGGSVTAANIFSVGWIDDRGQMS